MDDFPSRYSEFPERMKMCIPEASFGELSRHCKHFRSSPGCRTSAKLKVAVHSSGMRRFAWFFAGMVVLVRYSLFLNSSKVDFAKLLGIYVVLFFSCGSSRGEIAISSIIVKPDLPRWSFIVLGGLIMTLWKPQPIGRQLRLPSLFRPD
jgi:hypothetical protein